MALISTTKAEAVFFFLSWLYLENPHQNAVSEMYELENVVKALPNALLSLGQTSSHINI